MANRTLTMDVGRQSALYAILSVAFDQVADTGVAIKAIGLPYGAEVVGGHVVVDTANNAATTATLAIGDATVPNRYLAAVDMKTAGRTSLVPTGYVSDGSPILITPTIAGAAATAGALRIEIAYVIKNRASEVQTH